MLGKEIDLRNAEPILRCNGRARFVDARCVVFPGLTHRVPFHQECLFAACNKLDETRVDAFEGRIDERFLAPENTFALIGKVQHLAHGLPALRPTE